MRPGSQDDEPGRARRRGEAPQPRPERLGPLLLDEGDRRRARCPEPGEVARRQLPPRGVERARERPRAGGERRMEDQDRDGAHARILGAWHTRGGDRAQATRGRRASGPYVGLGANLGDAAATLAAGIHALAALPGARLVGVSRLYATQPVGVTDQPEFRNAVVALDVPAGPDPETGALALLLALKAIERAFGRQARERWGPRELDLDLLVFGRHAIRVERPPAARSDDPAKPAVQWLQVPHAERPRSALRARPAGRPRPRPPSARLGRDRRLGARPRGGARGPGRRSPARRAGMTPRGTWRSPT